MRQQKQLLRKKNGLVLFELLIFIALLALIFFLSTKFIATYNSFLVKAELEHLYSLFIYYQQKAYLDKQKKVIYLDIHKKQILCDNQIYNLPRAILFDAVSYINHMIFFYKDGNISAGAIYLTDKENSCLYALTTAVSQISYIRKYKYINKKWVVLR